MVTDERLAEMLAGLEGVPPGPWVPGYYEDGDPDGGPNGEFYPDGSILSVHDDGSYEHVDPWKEVVAKHFARCDPDTMRSILTELQSLRAQGGVRVKGLEWEDCTDGDMGHLVDTVIGRYAIEQDRLASKSFQIRLETVRCGSEEILTLREGLISIEAAKAAAQADYERRILSAITEQGRPWRSIRGT